MVSTTRLATGLGPLETIVNVQWGSLPVYVSVYVTANRTGLGAGTPHVATVTLTDLALSKGAEIVLSTGGTFGSPYNAYFKLVVIKVPHLVKGDLFTLRLSGSTQQIDFDPPDYTCGVWSSERTYTYISSEVIDIPSGLFIDGVEQISHVTVNHYTYAWSYVSPLGVDAGSQAESDVGPIKPNYHEFSEHSELIWIDDFGHVHTTGLSCDSTFPTGKVDVFPFNPVEVVVNPVKNHIVTDPGVAFFFDPAQAVKVLGSGDYEGDLTYLWQIFLTNHLGTSISSGLGDDTIRFAMQKALFSVKRTEKIIEVYPSTRINTGSGVRYDSGGPRFRLNNFVKFPPPVNAYAAAWDGGYHGEYSVINLFAGLAPPPVAVDPFLFPA